MRVIWELEQSLLIGDMGGTDAHFALDAELAELKGTGARTASDSSDTVQLMFNQQRH